MFAVVASVISADAQTPVAAGGGSYASSIPGDAVEFWAGNNVNIKSWHETVPLRVCPELKPPYPTNDWWSALLFGNNVKQPAQLWAHPLGVTVRPYGLGIHYPDSWAAVGGTYQETAFLAMPEPLQVGARGFKPVDQQVLSWGDWTVQFRILEHGNAYMDVTIGHGLPSVWVECHGLNNPEIKAPGAMFFDDEGKALVMPFTGDHLGIQWNGRCYGVHTGDGTVFSFVNDTLTLDIPGDRRYVTITALPARDKLAYFHRHAYAVPRSSRMDWKYDAESAKVRTVWSLETEALKGSGRAVIQGWIPHHYRTTTHNLVFDGNEYTTARGRMKCAAGNRFEIAWDFHGVPSHLPPSDSPDFDRARMSGFLDAFAVWPHPFNPETYAGGKQVAMFARQLACARMLDHPARETIRKRLRAELENLLTYTPGEPDKFFARSERLGGLIGLRCGFGSHRFNDHHFHYGYHVYAAAILGMSDPDFLAKFGDMARLVAKEYANWDRNDRRFPLLRTFDIWEGHSWANGGTDNSPWFGQNQESTSEAMMSWAAIILLGNTLGDDAMTAAGAMGHTIEAAATAEYWFNRQNDNFPAHYGPPGRISCITWGSQIQYITYFGPEPLFVHGIQYLPVLPSSHHLVHQPQAAATEFRYMLENSRNPVYKRFNTRDTWEVQWANEVMRYASMVEPEWANTWFEELWRKGDPKAKDAWESGLTYYMIHANRMLGRMQPAAWIAAPDSGVFINPKSNRTTWFASNPSGSAKSFPVFQNNRKFGRITVPARSVHSTFQPDPAP